ncbi:helix-turn-helix domain-containing protein [Patescibacteria group bacterium]|nr:helix-turn-helix domain-containing protein [Patescibacteria group bacterium]
MIKDYYKFIKELRIKKGLSQVEVAGKIGISRSSYIKFEQGKTELSLSEAAKLADMFGISLEEMKTGLKPNYIKYKQMILAFLRSDVAVDGKITKTKLAKLLYLSDFAWFYKHLESMSGMSYRKIQYGPVPDNYFRAIEELFEEGLINIDNKTKNGAFLVFQTRSGQRGDLSKLKAGEKKLIKEISIKWKGKRTQEIVKFTHDQLPFLICDDNEIIPYGLITQENPDHVY